MREKMWAVVKENGASNSISVLQVPLPLLQDGHVLIKVKATAICGSDLGAYRYSPNYHFIPLPVILGHEYSGEIIALGAGVTKWKIGDRVMAESNQYCGCCPQCLEERTNICSNNRMTGLHVDGGMAEYALCNSELLHAVDDRLSFSEATLVQPCSVSHHAVVDNSDVKSGSKVLVFGPGVLGLFSAQICRQLGAHVIVVGTPADLDYRLPLAEKMGFGTMVVSNVQEMSDKLMEHWECTEADWVIECSGSSQAVELGVDLVKKGGGLTLVGIYKENPTLEWSSLIRRELRLIASYTSSKKNYRESLRGFAEGWLTGEGMYSLFPLQEAPGAFLNLMECKVIKAVLLP
jgi:L-iditol 2-dehydrogenase